MYGAPYPQSRPPPPAKKGMSGCLIAVLVLGGISLIGVVVGVIFIAKVWSLFTPDEKAQLEGELRESMAASRGPAADALRAEGCFGVDVVDVATMPNLKRRLVDAGPTDAVPEKIIIDCRPNADSEAFTCERVAKAYLKGAGGKAPGPFRVMVHKVAIDQPLCSELHAADGSIMTADGDASAASASADAAPPTAATETTALDLTSKGLPLVLDVPACVKVSAPIAKIADNEHDQILACDSDGGTPAFAIQIGLSKGKSWKSDMQSDPTFKKWIKKEKDFLLREVTLPPGAQDFSFRFKSKKIEYQCFSQFQTTDEKLLASMIAACRSAREK